MAKAYSSMMPLGTIAPNFTLLDVISGNNVSLVDLKSDKGTVVMFICNHCPYVKHIQKQLVLLASEYISKGISFMAINSNDVSKYPDDSPENMKKVAENFNYPFAYLFDETQETAKAYQAECTPDFFIFDSELKCVYRGQLDDSSPGNEIEVTGSDIRNALNALLKGEDVSEVQRPSMGCSIKWKK